MKLQKRVLALAGVAIISAPILISAPVYALEENQNTSQVSSIKNETAVNMKEYNYNYKGIDISVISDHEYTEEELEQLYLQAVPSSNQRAIINEDGGSYLIRPTNKRVDNTVLNNVIGYFSALSFAKYMPKRLVTENYIKATTRDWFAAWGIGKSLPKYSYTQSYVVKFWHSGYNTYCYRQYVNHFTDSSYTKIKNMRTIDVGRG